MAEIIEGFAAFEQKLRELELSMQRKALIEVAKAGAQIVLDEAKRLAPRDTGALAEGMTMRVSGRESDINEGTVDVGPSKKTFYGSFQEFGTSHSRVQAFLGPALETSRERVTQVMQDEMLHIVDKVAA